MKTSDIRNAFLNYYKKNGHMVLPSSSLVPQNDDTLLFTNAGMVQFKDIFVGLEKRDYKRATTSQKCVRAGGKHNDLEQVGFTARHHTFFEMLGNFSFGDYFKEDAINFAWNFITKELGLPKEKLLATVYHTDEEAKSIWSKVAGSDFRIIPISTNDNFWSMGDTGPCGPCTEIFYDHGEHIFGGVPGSKDEDGDRFVEIWNLVFMQFEQMANGERRELAAKSIDTGMGLERITAVMQGKCDNYDIDLFQNLIHGIEAISHTELNSANKASYKVVADHLRSISFLIADGVFPSNEGRGYVLRRILRRAVRHGNLLGIKDPFIHKLVPNLVDIMKDAYPELETMQKTIISTVKLEEDKFMNTLDIGLNLLNSELDKLPNGGVLNGAVAFKLYDTYGFPVDLTMDIAKEKGISVDESGFNSAMAEQRSRANWKNSSYDKSKESVFFSIKEKLKEQKFLGYETTESTAKILHIVVDGNEVDRVEAGTHADIVTDRTPFYAECGGQVGDTGIIKKPLGSFVVENTQKIGGVICCEGKVENGSFSVGENVTLSVDVERRADIKKHHTATHLLQAALRAHIGNHVAQKGSFVGPDYLRFDFCSPTGIEENDLRAVESMVNNQIMSYLPVKTDIMSKDDAVKSGAMALFGEKYDNEVRVVSIVQQEENSCSISDNVISKELCGGTHVSNTGEIGLFKIISESSIGAGLRRIEAVAGNALLRYFNKKVDILNEVSSKLNSSHEMLVSKLDSTLQHEKALEKDLLALQQKVAVSSFENAEDVNGIKLRMCRLDGVSAKDMREVLDNVSKKYENSILVMMGKPADSNAVLVKVSKNLQNTLSAKDVLNSVLLPLNGRGGGSAALAQGGTNCDIDIDAVRENLKKLIKDLH